MVKDRARAEGTQFGEALSNLYSIFVMGARMCPRAARGCHPDLLSLGPQSAGGGPAARDSRMMRTVLSLPVAGVSGDWPGFITTDVVGSFLGDSWCGRAA